MLREHWTLLRSPTIGRISTRNFSSDSMTFTDARDMNVIPKFCLVELVKHQCNLSVEF